MLARIPMKHGDSIGPPREACRYCAHFRNDPAYLERAFKGMTSLSSGYSSARHDDGVCLRHDRYLSANSWCADFALSAGVTIPH